MKNHLQTKNGGNGGHGLNGQNALDLSPPKKSTWTIEVPGFFRKKRLKILAESIMLLPSGDISVTLDSSKGHYMGISRGHWRAFYSEDAF
jgi:hypothetical protein